MHSLSLLFEPEDEPIEIALLARAQEDSDLVSGVVQNAFHLGAHPHPKLNHLFVLLLEGRPDFLHLTRLQIQVALQAADEPGVHASAPASTQVSASNLAPAKFRPPDRGALECTFQGVPPAGEIARSAPRREYGDEHHGHLPPDPAQILPNLPVSGR